MEFLEVIFSGPDGWKAEHWGFVATVLFGLAGLFAWIFGAFSGLWRLLVWLWSRLRPRAPVMIGVPHAERAIVGRKSHLHDLRKGLRRCGAVTVHGAGGQGKSTLARHYVEQYGRRYKGVLHVVAETETALVGGLLALKPTLNLDLRDMPETAAARSLLAALPEHGRWLLIYDNVPDLAEIKGLRPPKGVDLIVTTRAGTGWDGFAKVAPGVLPFDKEDAPAVRLLMQEAERDTDAAGARALAEALGGLPLALVVAGALIRDTGESFDTYRARVGEIIAHVPVNSDYPDSVAGAVRMTYARLSADARALADLCAWLAPEGLTEALFAGAVAKQNWSDNARELLPDLRAVLEDPARLRQGLQELRRWSVLSGEGLMHRLTQAVLRGGQTEERWAFVWALGAASILMVQFPHEKDDTVDLQGNWEICRELMPHVRALWGMAHEPWREQWGKPDWAAMGNLLAKAGVFLSNQEDRESAILLNRGSLELKEARLGEGHPDVPDALGNLAIDLAAVGKAAYLAEASDMMARAIRLHELHRGKDMSAYLAGSYMQQVTIAMRRISAGGEIAEGAEDEAEAALKHAEANWETRFSPISEEMALIWNQKGYLRNLQGRGPEALAAYRRALDITQKLKEPELDKLAMRAMNAGSVALKLGRAEEAQDPLRQAYALAREIYSNVPDHPFNVACCGWLVDCLLVMARKGHNGARGKALDLCERHGLDLAEREARVGRFPLEPVK